MLEEDVRVAPRLPHHRLRPRVERRRVVVEAVQPEIAPGRRAQRRAGEVVLFRDAHRHVAIAERGHHVLVEPALVAELEHELAVRRQQPEERLQPIDILLQVRRELKEDRPHPAA